MSRILGFLLLLAPLTATAPLAAQSLLDRPPNVSGDWVAPTGTVQFNFLHRFVASSAPARKVTNFPTFVIGAGLPRHTQVGFLYATNSTLTPNYPNEWEFYGRWLPLSQDRGAPLDLGGQVGYNLAVKGLDGEISIGRALGPVRLIGVTRVLDDPQGGSADVALGGGLVLRLHRYIALAGDVVTLTHRDSVTGEKPAWSAGVHVAIPGTPHTLSIQATNTSTATLEGASRGTSQRRYGFEFTIPFTLARYFGRRQPAPPPPAAPAAPPAPGDTSAAARTGADREGEHEEHRLSAEPDRDPDGHDGGMDQRRCGPAHRDRRRPQLRLGKHGARRHLAAHVHEARYLRVFLRGSSVHEGYGDRQGGQMTVGRRHFALLGLALAGVVVVAACFSEHTHRPPRLARPTDHQRGGHLLHERAERHVQPGGGHRGRQRDRDLDVGRRGGLAPQRSVHGLAELHQQRDPERGRQHLPVHVHGAGHLPVRLRGSRPTDDRQGRRPGGRGDDQPMSIGLTVE